MKFPVKPERKQQLSYLVQGHSNVESAFASWDRVAKMIEELGWASQFVHHKKKRQRKKLLKEFVRNMMLDEVFDCLDLSGTKYEGINERLHGDAGASTKGEDRGNN